MDAAQFTAFIQAEQKDRRLLREAGQAEHIQRQQILTESEARRRAEQQIQKVPKCDGATTKAVREWIREIGFTIPYSGLTVFIAGHTAEGPLRREIERFLSEATNRDNVTWDQIKTHIQQQFWSQYEAERLRDEVDKVKQSAYENTMTYGRRFRDTADLGYPPGNRNADQQRVLLKAHLRGLRDRHMVERLVKEGRPADFTAAMTLAQQYESDEYKLHKALEGTERQEEPMEIGAMNGQVLPEGVAKDIGDLQRKVGGMSQQITKLIAMQQPKQTFKGKGQQNRQYKFTADGKPICWRCSKVGHKGFECRTNPPRPKPQQGGQ